MFKISGRLLYSLSAALGLLFVSTVAAGTMTFTNTETGQTGTGFGNVVGLLALHPTGQQSADFGSVLWNGSTDVLNAGPGAGGNATNQSQTQTAATVAALTSGNEFALIFNIAQQGSNSTVTLHDFSLRFMDPSGGTLFDLTYNASPGGDTLTQAGNGVGAAGWLFLVDLTDDEATSFFSDAGNRLGMFIDLANAIGNANGAPESFFIQASNNSDPPTLTPSVLADPALAPVPEPPSVLVWFALALASAAATAVAGRWRRRRLVVA